jgi:Leucine-rich repeat (LRR) protein
LSNNELTGAIPTGEENDSVNLKVMYLKGNALEGNLPFFPKLQRVLAQRNQLTSMDEEYATEGQSLVYLYVYSNQLSGQLPSSWNTPNLEIFDVGFNSLEGPIGQDLWDLPALKSLVVDNNRLTGTLPESSANTLLSTVWLDANQLEGSIPSNFGSNWSNLTSLKLQGNSLTGTITDDHCSNWPTSDSTSTEWELESDCNTDAVECSCCTMCFPERQRQNLRR